MLYYFAYIKLKNIPYNERSKYSYIFFFLFLMMFSAWFYYAYLVNNQTFYIGVVLLLIANFSNLFMRQTNLDIISGGLIKIDINHNHP